MNTLESILSDWFDQEYQCTTHEPIVSHRDTQEVSEPLSFDHIEVKREFIK